MERNTSTAFRLRNRPQVWKAYKRILQYVQSSGLKQGDRLPVQPELRKILGLCGSTHGAAMDALLADGALIAKQRIGTLVADASAIDRVPWTIGIVAIPIEWQAASAFTADLFARMQAALSRAGCGCVTYHNQGPWPSPLEEYGKLGSDLAHGDLDGVIAMTNVDPADWKNASANNVPICHTHWWEATPAGVLVDQAAWAQDAVKLLVERGCKRLAAASNSERDSVNNRFWRAFDRAIKSARLPSAGATLALDSKSGFRMEEVAHEQAQRLLRLPPSQRPDGLILTDDQFASHLSIILRETSNYRPMMAVQTNRQHPRIFLLPIFAYEVDIQELAHRTVNLLLERVRNPAAPERIEWHVPKLLTAEPRSSLSALMAR